MSDALGGGALSPVRALARTLLSYVETRARLAANEVEEHSLRLTEVALWWLAAIACLVVALVTLSVLAVLLAREEARPFVAALVVAAWIGGAVVCALVARARKRERPKLLSATLGELQKDRERFEKPHA